MYYVAEKTPVSEWLTTKLIERQRKRGERINVTEFAEWLGISRTNLSRYINGLRQPSDEDDIEKLAAKLGTEIYRLLGRVTPDPLDQRVNELLPDLNEVQKKQLIAEAEQMLTRRKKAQGAEG